MRTEYSCKRPYLYLATLALWLLWTPLNAWGQNPDLQVKLDGKDTDATVELARIFSVAPKTLALRTLTASDETLDLNLSSYDPFSHPRRVTLDGRELDPVEFGAGKRYYRGQINAEPDSFAFMSVSRNGASSVVVIRGDIEYHGRTEGSKFTLERSTTTPKGANIDWPATDVVIPPKLTPPSGPAAPLNNAGTAPQSTAERSESIGITYGWYGPYTITVPAGQAYVGAVNRGPGIANTYVVTSGQNPLNNSYCEYSRCFIESPAAGDYDVYVYKFDSSNGGLDLATTVNYGYNATLTNGELYGAEIAVDVDDELYIQSFGSSPSTVSDYLAQLFAYNNVHYENEVSTRLLVGDIVLYTSSSDPYSDTTDTLTRLNEVKDQWRDNNAGIDRSLVMHITTYDIGGGIASLDQVCDSYGGYSVSGILSETFTNNSQINWDSYVTAHELGHNFSSPHTHCYAGLEGNTSPVDACWNQESSCWSGSTNYPGAGSLTGGSSGGQNGTIMSYCHQLSGGISNIARTFGLSHPYGVEADRVPSKMSRRTAQIAAASSECLAKISASASAFNVSPSSSTGGSISPSTSQTVAANGTQDFTLTADQGYTLQTPVGGTCPGNLSNNTYTAGPITENCTVIANYGLDSYTVSVSSAGNGTVDPSGDQAVAYGETLEFTATPDSGYVAGSVSGTCPAGSWSGSTYTTGAITADCSVIANFDAIPELTSGTAATNLSGAQYSDEYFYIDVPANASTLTVQLTVDTGDPDIYADTSFPPPKTSSAECYSQLSAGNNESCTINSPSEGRYFVRVYGYTAYSGAALTASVVAPPGTPSISAITPGNESLSVAFTPGSGSTPTSYSVSCTDQGASRLASANSSAQTQIGPHFDSSSPVTFSERNYPNLAAYHQSAEFQLGGARCATDAHMASQRGSATTFNAMSDRAADCSFSNTTIDSDYAPVDGQTLIIPVYFHVIYKADGTGYVSEARIQAQMAVLNEDFAGFSGTGYLTSIQFELVDINYVQNDGWYTDAGPNMPSQFKSSLAVDPTRYMNIYTNDAGGGGVLGYASLAANASTGSSSDGVVMLHNTIGGRNNGYGNFDEGRTLVHEVGHYLGLEHTFMPSGSCDLPNDYTHGDLIADTPAQLSPDFGTSSSSNCGAASAIENFMNYSNDSAMYTFTAEQTNRMICSLMSYRSNAYSVTGVGSTVTATGSSSPISVTGLTNNNSYSCAVTASNADGSSSASIPVVGTPAPTAPGVPTISRTDYGDGEIYLYVTVSDDGGSAVTGYTATCSDGSTSFSGTSTSSPITVSGLTNDASYTCTATATNAVGASTNSTATDPITPAAIANGLPIWLLYEATTP